MKVSFSSVALLSHGPLNTTYLEGHGSVRFSAVAADGGAETFGAVLSSAELSGAETCSAGS